MFTHIICSSAATATAVTPGAIERMHAETREQLLAVRFRAGEAEARLDVQPVPAAPFTDELRGREFA